MWFVYFYLVFAQVVLDSTKTSENDTWLNLFFQQRVIYVWTCSYHIITCGSLEPIVKTKFSKPYGLYTLWFVYNGFWIQEYLSLRAI